MIDDRDNRALRDGHYATKQIFCRDRLVAWSHRSRFEAGLRLARPFAGRRLLDYGCGDGTFLGLLCGGPDRPGEAVGAELDDFQVQDCAARLGGQPGLSFTRIEALDGPAHAGHYDVVFCMEVLEHVVDVDTIVDRLWRVLAPGGTLVVSVPVETGVPLLVKQAVRHVAGWRGIGDYPGVTPYTTGEYVKSLFAGRRQHIPRPVLGAPGAGHHDHKGFNWRALGDRLSTHFAIERTLASPVAWLGPHLATQVWFVARRRPAPEPARL